MSFNEYWQAERVRREIAAMIRTLERGDQAAERALLLRLAAAQLFLPVGALPPGMRDGEPVRQPGVPLKVRMVRTREEQRFLPLFTSEPQIQRSAFADNHFVVVPFSGAAQLAVQNGTAGIVVDQGEGPSFVIPVAALQGLAARGNQGGAPDGRPRGARLHLSPPPRLLSFDDLRRLEEWLRREPEIVQAYLFGLAREKNRVMLTLGIGCPGGLSPERIRELARSVSGILGASGVILLDANLAQLLARQPGAIRFELEAARTPPTPPPSDPPP